MKKLIKLYSFLKENHIKEAELLKKALVSNAHFIITPDNNIFLVTQSLKGESKGKNVKIGNIYLEKKGKIIGNKRDLKYGIRSDYRPGLLEYSFYSDDLLKRDVYAPHIELDEEYRSLGLGEALYKAALWHCKTNLKGYMISLNLPEYPAFKSKIGSNQMNIEFLDLFYDDNQIGSQIAILSKSKKSREENIEKLENIYEEEDPREEFNQYTIRTAMLHNTIEDKSPVYPVFFANFDKSYEPPFSTVITPDFKSKSFKGLEMKHPELTEEQLDNMNKEDYQFGFEDNYGESFSTPYD